MVMDSCTADECGEHACIKISKIKAMFDSLKFEEKLLGKENREEK